MSKMHLIGLNAFYMVRVLLCYQQTCSQCQIPLSWFTHVVDSSKIPVPQHKFVNIYHEHAFKVSRSFQYIFLNLLGNRTNILIMEADVLPQILFVYRNL